MFKISRNRLTPPQANNVLLDTRNQDRIMYFHHYEHITCASRNGCWNYLLFVCRLNWENCIRVFSTPNTATYFAAILYHAFKLGYIATAWDLVALCAVIDEELCLITPHVTQDTEAMLLYSTTTAPTIASMLMPTAARECSRLLLIYADIYVSNAAEWPGRMRFKC